jgi:adenosylcobinamide-GDP ribazoletransferase
MAEPRSTLGDGLRLAVTTLTVVPMRPGRIDRASARVAMLAAPAVGLVIGIGVALLMYAARQLWGFYGIQGGISAVLALAALAGLSGGMHLDGLADTADGLGASATQEQRLAIMRGSEVGAFGVAAVALVLVAQVVALTTTVNTGLGTVSIITAVTTSRLAVTWGCVRGFPAARKDGLGAVVAESVGPVAALILTVATTAGLSAIAIIHDHGGLAEVGRVCGSVGAGLAAAFLLRLAAQRRIGGMTGDVLGATVEVVVLVVLLAVAVRAPNLR